MQPTAKIAVNTGEYREFCSFRERFAASISVGKYQREKVRIFSRGGWQKRKRARRRARFRE